MHTHTHTHTHSQRSQPLSHAWPIPWSSPASWPQTPSITVGAKGLSTLPCIDQCPHRGVGGRTGNSGSRGVTRVCERIWESVSRVSVCVCVCVREHVSEPYSFGGHNYYVWVFVVTRLFAVCTVKCLRSQTCEHHRIAHTWVLERGRNQLTYPDQNQLHWVMCVSACAGVLWS